MLETVSCVFCDLLANRGPATWVARDHDAAAFLPLEASSLAPGHTLVIPKHSTARNLLDEDPQVLGPLILGVQRVARAVRAVLQPDGVVEPTHAARQLVDGSWSSKLGRLPLIRHLEPHDLDLGRQHGFKVSDEALEHRIGQAHATILSAYSWELAQGSESCTRLPARS